MCVHVCVCLFHSTFHAFSEHFSRVPDMLEGAVTGTRLPGGDSERNDYP